MLQYINLSQNPSFGSKDRVQKQNFGQNLNILKCCDIENKVKHNKISSTLAHSLQYSHASLVKIKPLVCEIGCGKDWRKRLIFTVFIGIGLNQTMCLCKSGQNPSTGSEDNVRKRLKRRDLHPIGWGDIIIVTYQQRLTSEKVEQCAYITSKI